MEKEYWNGFYDETGAPVRQSDFAEFVYKDFAEVCEAIVDVGCGNGRDTFYFATKGIKSVGIDQSDYVVKENINKISPNLKNISFHQGNFSTFEYNELPLETISIYSRFTLHSINYDEEKAFFENLKLLNNLRYLFIEVRSINDSIYGEGDEVGKHEFVTSHYRRFIDAEILKENLKQNYELIYFEESTGFSKTVDDDPCLIRVVAKKR